jgi:hypothetical protein
MAFVTAKVGIKAPHDATVLKTVTISAATGAPLGFVTVTVIVEVVVPSGGMARGLASTTTVFGVASGGLTV